MVALQYDVKIQDSAFRMKGSNGMVEGAPDIRQRRKDVEEECCAGARRFNELGFGSENPYSKGGERSDWNPCNGQPKPQAPRYSNQRNNANFAKFSSNNNNDNSYNNSSNSTRGGKGSGRSGKSGYLGPPELFDPNYAEKRAAAAKAKTTV